MRKLVADTFDLKRAIAYASGKVVRIAGGSGLARDDPILITEDHHGLAVELEYFVAKEAAVFYGFWGAEVRKANLIDIEDKKIDELIVAFEDQEGDPQESMLYFDITPAFFNTGKTLENVKSKEDLDQVYDGGYHKTVEPVPHFYAAVHWALSREEGDPDDVWGFLWMLGIEEEELAQELQEKLQECGL